MFMVTRHNLNISMNSLFFSFSRRKIWSSTKIKTSDTRTYQSRSNREQSLNCLFDLDWRTNRSIRGRKTSSYWSKWAKFTVSIEAIAKHTRNLMIKFICFSLSLWRMKIMMLHKRKKIKWNYIELKHTNNCKRSIF